MSSKEQKIEILTNFIESNEFKYCHQAGKIEMVDGCDFRNTIIKYTIRKVNNCSSIHVSLGILKYVS